MQKHHIYLKNIARLLSILVFLILAWYLYQNRNVFSALRFISWQLILLILVIDTLSFLVISFMNFAMIKKLDHRVNFPICIALQYSNNFLNKFLPTIGGGAAFRAVFLKKKYDFPYSFFMSTIVGTYVINFLITPFIGLACLIIIYFQTGEYNLMIILLFNGLFLPSLFIVFFSPQIPESKNRFLKILKRTIDGWNLLKNDTRYIFIYGFLSIALLFLTSLIKLIIYKTLWGNVDFISILYLSTLGVVMPLLNFTPGGIGIKEGLYLFSADLVRIPGDILVLGSLLLQAITIIKSLIIGGISYLVLMRQMNQFTENERFHSKIIHKKVDK